MKKLLLFAAVAGLGLVSASPPKGPDNGPREARRDYPPCSRTVTDRCMQIGGRHARRHGWQQAARGGGHGLRAPAAADRRLAHRIRRAGERG